MQPVIKVSVKTIPKLIKYPHFQRIKSVYRLAGGGFLGLKFLVGNFYSVMGYARFKRAAGAFAF